MPHILCLCSAARSGYDRETDKSILVLLLRIAFAAVSLMLQLRFTLPTVNSVPKPSRLRDTIVSLGLLVVSPNRHKF